MPDVQWREPPVAKTFSFGCVFLVMNRQSAEPARTVARLQGMRDLQEGEWRRKEGLQDRLARLLGSWGYRRLETPVLEPTELFMRKSGGELASQLYSFNDAGSNPVSLRPEFTSPIMRHYLENSASVQTPARWQYCGPVFRFDGPGMNSSNGASAPGSGGQFTQLGGELIGASSLMADVELLSLAASVPTAVGLKDWQLQLADLDVLESLLTPVGLSERARSFIIQSVPRLREGRTQVSQLLEEGRHLHLMGEGADGDYLSDAVRGLDDTQARVVLLGLLQWNSVDQLGQRTPEDVVDRLLRKIQGDDSEEKLRRGLESASRLAKVQGAPAEALAAAKAVLSDAGADQSAADRLGGIFGLLQDHADLSDHVVLDFGLVRGLAYYNGVIFEVTHPDWPGPLGGGGRYDNLARALGARDRLPALGFAYNLDALISLTNDPNAAPGDAGDAAATLVLPADKDCYDQALTVARELREAGETAELEVGGLGLEKAKRYAANRGISRVLSVGKDGQRTTHEIG